MINKSEFSNNLSAVKKQIKDVCDISGRSLDEVKLLPVTKNWPVEAVSYCMDHGIERVGENRVQEAIKKMDVQKGMKFELIGHLQSNKAKLAVGAFNRIQSIDSSKILNLVGRLAKEKNIVQEVLLQVNAGNDPAKYGISIEEARQLLEEALGISSISVEGFMTIAPYAPNNNEVSRQCFSKLRELRDNLAHTYGMKFGELSMGMSGDLKEAISEGSTMIRVGSALFGQRL